MSEKPIFKGNLTAWNVSEIRDYIQAQLIGRSFTFVEVVEGVVLPPVVEANLRLSDAVQKWGKVNEEGHTGFRVSTTNGLHDYNAHSSGLVSVSVLVEIKKITITFNSEGNLVHHVYAIQDKS